MNENISAHFVIYSRLVSNRVSELLDFLLTQQRFKEFSLFEHTDFIGDPKWKVIPKDRTGFKERFAAQAQKNPSRPLLLADRDVGLFNVLVTESPEFLDGPRFEPTESQDTPGQIYPSSSVDVRLHARTLMGSGGGADSVMMERFLGFLIDLFEILGADFGKAHDTTDSIALDGSADKMSFIPGLLSSKPRVMPGRRTMWPLQSVYWANFFSKRWSGTVERVIAAVTTPGLHTRALPSGGILVLTAASPLAPSEKANREALWAVWKSAGLGPLPNRAQIWKLTRQWSK